MEQGDKSTKLSLLMQNYTIGNANRTKLLQTVESIHSAETAFVDRRRPAVKIKRKLVFLLQLFRCFFAPSDTAALWRHAVATAAKWRHIVATTAVAPLYCRATDPQQNRTSKIWALSLVHITNWTELDWTGTMNAAFQRKRSRPN